MNKILTQKVKFPLGQIVSTPNALNQINNFDIAIAIERHARGDWGDLCNEDRAENELGLKKGFRLFSVYHDSKNVKFWIITEADRSVTTVLMPEDY